jgi:hypothetical protein
MHHPGAFVPRESVGVSVLIIEYGRPACRSRGLRSRAARFQIDWRLRPFAEGGCKLCCAHPVDPLTGKKHCAGEAGAPVTVLPNPYAFFGARLSSTRRPPTTMVGASGALGLAIPGPSIPALDVQRGNRQTAKRRSASQRPHDRRAHRRIKSPPVEMLAHSRNNRPADSPAAACLDQQFFDCGEDMQRKDTTNSVAVVPLAGVELRD